MCTVQLAKGKAEDKTEAPISVLLRMGLKGRFYVGFSGHVPFQARPSGLQAPI